MMLFPGLSRSLKTVLPSNYWQKVRIRFGVYISVAITTGLLLFMVAAVKAGYYGPPAFVLFVFGLASVSLAFKLPTVQRIALLATTTCALVCALVFSGGMIYYKIQRDAAEESAEFERQTAAQEARNQESAAQIQQQQKDMGPMGLSPTQIVDKFANATVLVSAQWRLYERESGKPLFHKVFKISIKGVGTITVPAYVILRGKLYRWLTTDDQVPRNFEVGATESGTGFVVADQGWIVTNKHVAAGWLIDTGQFSTYENGQGLVFEAQNKFLPPEQFDKEVNKRTQFLYASNNPAQYQGLTGRETAESGPVFANQQPVIVGDDLHTFEGSNDALSVRFPGSRVDVNARLVRAAADTDAALIKIDTKESLSSIPLAQDDTIKVGERVIVLGYPAITKLNVAATGAGELRERQDTLLHPAVAEGSISDVSLQQIGNLMTMQPLGRLYRLTLPGWPGSSGGPVFDSRGQVIGLLTYGSGREAATYAVPIKNAQDLIIAALSGSQNGDHSPK